MVHVRWALTSGDHAAVVRLLGTCHLTFDKTVSDTVMIWDDGQLVGTGSLDDNVLKCIAVLPACQGEGFLGTIMTALVSRAFGNGNSHLFIFTKPENRQVFLPYGFYPVAQTKQELLLENRKHGLKDYLSSLHGRRTGKVGAIVMHADPFTLGHRYLIERAASLMDEVQVFVLSSRKGFLPPADRYRLVCEGTRDLENVIVQETCDYLVSPATFPTYFLPEGAELFNVDLDISIFLDNFVPELHITDRFVGTEPLSKVTASYNAMLLQTLPEKGVHVAVVDRLVQNGEIVSASVVRERVKQGAVRDIRAFVPDCTYAYFCAKEEEERVQTEKV